jgi:hypothetical protein
MDTTNGQAVANGAAPVGSRTIPRGIKPRYAVYKAPGPYVKNIPIQSAAGVAGLPGTLTMEVPGGTAVFKLSRTKGEEEKLSQDNTGLLL